jgi:hypothetical protein
LLELVGLAGRAVGGRLREPGLVLLAAALGGRERGGVGIILDPLILADRVCYLWVAARARAGLG